MGLDPLGSGFGSRARDGRGRITKSKRVFISPSRNNSIDSQSPKAAKKLRKIGPNVRGHSFSQLEGAVKMHIMFRKFRALIFLTNVFLNRAGTVARVL